MKITNLLIAGALVLLCGSCSSSKRSPLTYFIDIDSYEQAIPTGDYLVKIEPGDELFITVTSLVNEATAPYNLPLINPATNALLTSYNNPEQQTYIVDSKGNIQFPVLGDVHLAGLDLEQAREKLTELISKDVEDPLVKLEMMNFYVNVAGEVGSPGRFRITKPRYSILEALTAAGDLTVYGERNNVLVVREENGQRIHGRVDLNSPEALNSPFFYLKQNDYVYVEPNKIRKANSKYNQDNAFKLSVISTIVSASSVIASLVIALTVKK